MLNRRRRRRVVVVVGSEACKTISLADRQNHLASFPINFRADGGGRDRHGQRRRHVPGPRTGRPIIIVAPPNVFRPGGEVFFLIGFFCFSAVSATGRRENGRRQVQEQQTRPGKRRQGKYLVVPAVSSPSRPRPPPEDRPFGK